jgi:acetoin utilization deacetylase AcuC-like enzyme
VTTVAFLYDPVFLEHETPRGHPEEPRRLRRIVEVVERSGLGGRLVHLPPQPAGREALLAAHDGAYLDRLALPGERYLTADTYLSPGTWKAAQFAAGAVCTAVRACREGVVERAFCAVRPPGHHAERAAAMGFCYVNNAAVGARYAQQLGYGRVMIADFDAHHGNGTQHTFYDDDSVFYFSTHEYPLFPGTGASTERGVGKGTGFTRNLPLRAGAGDGDLLRAWRETFPADVASFRPDCCLVSAGYDLLAGDPLTDLLVSEEGVRLIVRSILDACAGIPVVFTLEGGYNQEHLARCVGVTLEEMLR